MAYGRYIDMPCVHNSNLHFGMTLLGEPKVRGVYFMTHMKGSTRFPLSLPTIQSDQGTWDNQQEKEDPVEIDSGQ